jgi:peptide/nickel transport system substrate-binding protein
MKQIMKIAGIAIFVLLFAAVSLKLFYPEFYSLFVNEGKNENVSVEDRNLVIGLDSLANELEPTYYDLATRNRLLQIYEPLLMPDKNLNFKPVLALNYGKIDDKKWKFRLREDVKFHDGGVLKVEDVIASIKRAKNHKNSQLKDVLETVAGVKKLSGNEFEVLLNREDPLFLNRISTVLVLPEKFADGSKLAPIGTGSYMYMDDKDGELTLKRYESYWGKKPVFTMVSILSLDDLDKWTEAYTTKDLDLAVSVPASLVKDVKAGDFGIVAVPGLAVTFLAFNFDSNVFGETDIREAVKFAVDRNVFAEIGGGVLYPATQFVSSGVYGFDTDLELSEQDVYRAREYVKSVFPFNRPVVEIDLLKGQESIGEYLKGQMSDIGMDVSLNLLDREELEEKIISGKSDAYIFGFRSELGDAYDFFTSVVHKEGKYNGNNYSNEILNRKIEESSTVEEAKERLELLKEIMRDLVEEDVYGVPLYESKSIYAISDKLDFEPRIDGYVLAKEIK